MYRVNIKFFNGSKKEEFVVNNKIIIEDFMKSLKEVFSLSWRKIC